MGIGDQARRPNVRLANFPRMGHSTSSKGARQPRLLVCELQRAHVQRERAAASRPYKKWPLHMVTSGSW